MMGLIQTRLPHCNMTSKSSLSHLCLLFYAFTVGAAVKVVVNTPSIQVTRGGSILLPCSFRTTAALNRLNIIWTVSPLQQPQQPLQVISYEQGQIVESLSEYLGRVTFALQPTRDASIVLNHSRVSDTGTYQCTVINPPDGATPNIGIVGLTVLVPPSTPDCSSDGHGLEGGSIRLRCSVKEGIPMPTIRWEKILPSAQQLISSQEEYQASATLTNLTSETSGLYRCTVTNQLGSQTCAMELYVRVGGLGSTGIFVAITITLIMGLVLLALFFLVLCLHQQSRGKWQDGGYSVDNVPSGRGPGTRSPCSDRSTSSRGPPPILYRVCQSPASLRLTQEVSTISRQWSPAPLCSELEMSTTTSEENTTGSEDEEHTSPALRSSIYSGYLV
ncbi:immunoglobulin superfamily member 11-like [Eleutherodactylus coqui]|uniref:immunoglobulin superfamily member 11-like n=1 Tax=Eleutherodactylus coqui TaxID=57060 RepID=UPI003462ABFB